MTAYEMRISYCSSDMCSSVLFGVPAMSVPSASVSGDVELRYEFESMISRIITISRFWFGISMPTTDLPSMTSMTRTLDTDNERARSRDRLVICEPFTPGAGWISKRVMTGPGVAATTCALTPNDSRRSEEHTSELQSLMRISYAVFCLKKKNTKNTANKKVKGET